MKSEERHELKRNDLATGLTDLPGLWQRHGNKVLIIVAVAFLVLAAVRYKRAQAAGQQEQTRQQLANAWAGVDEMTRRVRSPALAELSKFNASLETEINQSVQAVTGDAAVTPMQAAWAWLARGELYWSLAHSTPAIVPPTTSTATQTAATQAAASQPAAKTPAEYLTLAATAYGTVVRDFKDVSVPTKMARFSLAAVAEEQHDLAAARSQYKALIETADLPATDKSMAEARLAKLDDLEKPVLLLPATQPTGPKPMANDDFMQQLMKQLPPGTKLPAPAATQPK